MKQLALVLLALSVVACSGGGGGGTPTPPTPKPQNHVAFSSRNVQPAAMRRTNSARIAQDSCGLPSNEILQATANYSPSPGDSWQTFYGAQVQAAEVSPQCSPDPSASPATYTTSDANVASFTLVSLAGRPTPSPLRAGQTYLAGVNPGSAIVTATFPDGTTGQMRVSTYGQLGVSCNPYYVGGTDNGGETTGGWSAANGKENINQCGHIVNPEPSFDLSVGYNNNVIFPYGYDVVAPQLTDPSQLQTISSCASFSSQGTILDLTTVGSGSEILFKTVDGKCVKMSVQVQPDNVGIVGLYAVSDASGNFSY